MTSGIEEAAIRQMLKKRGRPESEIDEVVNMMKNPNSEYGGRLREQLEMLQLGMQTLQGIDPATRATVAPLIASSIANNNQDSGRGSYERDMRAMEVEANRLRMIKNIYGDDEANKKYEELAKKFDEMTKNQLLQTLEQKYEQKLQIMQQTIDQMKQGGGGLTSKESLNGILEQVNLIRGIRGEPEVKSITEMFAGRPDAPENIEKYKNLLNQAGYRIEGPPTMEDISNKMNEMRQKTREDVMKELQVEDRRNQMLITFGTEVAGAIFSAFGNGNMSSGKGKEAMDSINGAIKGMTGVAESAVSKQNETERDMDLSVPSPSLIPGNIKVKKAETEEESQNVSNETYEDSSEQLDSGDYY